MTVSVVYDYASYNHAYYQVAVRSVKVPKLAIKAKLAGAQDLANWLLNLEEEATKAGEEFRVIQIGS